MRQLLAICQSLDMRQSTPTFLLLETRLGDDLTQHVTTARADGKSWDDIGRDLLARTGVSVTRESLRSWFNAMPRGERGMAS